MICKKIDISVDSYQETPDPYANAVSVIQEYDRGLRYHLPGRRL